jgi:5-formyltetrahydrofolate cyclo-ligase
MTKDELRKELLAQRKALSEAEVAMRSKLLCDRLFATFDFSFLKVVHIFLPIERQREPDTWLVMDRLRREFPHVRIALPKMLPGGLLVHVEFEGLHQLRTNKWGIPEPQQGTELNPQLMDMVVVPLLAADRNGHRLGYGKGFYDRFLAEVKPKCVTVGYSLLEVYQGELPHDGWDVPLSHVITATEVVSTAAG